MTRAVQTARADDSRSLDETVFERLRERIADGSLLPGQAVRTGKLATELGVSRTPVVNALKRLNQAGLVEWVANSGAFVRRFSPLELAQVFELREVLEGLAARHAATRLDETRIDELEALFTAFRDCGEKAPGPRAVRDYLAADRRFHGTIIDVAASAPLRRSLDHVHITTTSYAAGLVRTVSSGIAEHAVILQAFRDRDPEAAESAMRSHLRRSVDWLYEAASVDAADRDPEGSRD